MGWVLWGWQGGLGWMGWFMVFKQKAARIALSPRDEILL